MKRSKFVLAGLVAIMLVLVAFVGVPTSDAGLIQGTSTVIKGQQLAIPSAWNLAADFRVFPNQANANPDSYGNDDIWSFMYSTTAHDPSTYGLITQFIPNVNERAGWQGWLGPELHPSSQHYNLPRVSMNTTGMPMVIDQFSTVPPAVVEVHPDSVQPAIVGWHSPFTGAIAIAGGVADLSTSCGDGVDWFIDRNSTTLASGAYPNGGSQLFQDGINGTQLANIAVDEADFIYFLIAPGSGSGCDWTQLDVTITMVSVSKPVAPTLISPANDAMIPKGRVMLEWSALPFATHYKVLVKDEANATIAALTVFEASRINLSLKPNKTYSWHVKACNSGGCSTKSEVWQFSR